MSMHFPVNFTVDATLVLNVPCRLPLATFEQVLEMAQDGCRRVAEFMRSQLMEHTKRLGAARGIVRA
jgi:hypothetical protein